jgi:hypothetical protein
MNNNQQLEKYSVKETSTKIIQLGDIIKADKLLPEPSLQLQFKDSKKFGSTKLIQLDNEENVLQANIIVPFIDQTILYKESINILGTINYVSH